MKVVLNCCGNKPLFKGKSESGAKVQPQSQPQQPQAKLPAQPSQDKVEISKPEVKCEGEACKKPVEPKCEGDACKKTAEPKCEGDACKK